MVVYTEVDVMPENEGGMGALMSKLNKSILVSDTTVGQEYSPNHSVAFIIDTNGSTKGGRVLKTGSFDIENQILSVVTTYKWTPAMCNRKRVPMLYKFGLIVDIRTE